MCLPVGENRLIPFRNEDDATANPHRHSESPFLPLVTPISFPLIFQRHTRPDLAQLDAPTSRLPFRYTRCWQPERS
jgi:hypothetical protein